MTTPELTAGMPLFMQPGMEDLDAVFAPRLFRVGVLDALFSRAGVINYDAGDLRVTQRGSGANMSVDIAAGRAAVRGTRVSGQGTYVCISTGTENRTVTAPSSGSRAYRISARVRDKAATAALSTPDTASDWVIESAFAAGTTPPPVPASAISLATFVLTSSSSSVTTGMITDTRGRAASGTAALTGTWGSTGFANVWGADDVTRPLTWMKNPDGWVTLGGWIRRKNETATVKRNEFWAWDRNKGWDVGAAVLPPEIRPVGGVRDTVTITSNGDLHLVFFPNGRMNYRFQYDTTLTAGDASNQTWVSFDGVSYRSESRF